MLRLAAVLVALLLTAVACGDGRGAPVAQDGERDDPSPFTVIEVDAPEGRMVVLLADTEEERRIGLSNRDDLGGYDGMLFRFPSDTTGGFWMKDTTIPLSIAWFDAEGYQVGSADMDPCPDGEECPVYRPDGPYRVALEVPQGELERWGLAERGSRLQRACDC